VARRHIIGLTAHDAETNCVFRQCHGTVRAVFRRAAPWLESGKPPTKMPPKPKDVAVAWGTYIERNGCCLLQAIDANPEATQFYLHCADEPFATSQSSNLKASQIHTTSAILAPAHIPAPGNSLDGTSTHSYHIRPLFLYIAPLFPGTKTPRLQSMIFHSFHATPALPIVADSLRLCMASCLWH
jgi:hypothetical protein